MIIFLYGEDNFRSQCKLLEIKQKYIQSDESGSGLSIFDYDDDKNIFSQVKNAISTTNLLSPKRLLVIKNLILSNSESDQKNILEYLEKNTF